MLKYYIAVSFREFTKTLNQFFLNDFSQINMLQTRKYFSTKITCRERVKGNFLTLFYLRAPQFLGLKTISIAEISHAFHILPRRSQDAVKGHA